MDTLVAPNNPIGSHRSEAVDPEKRRVDRRPWRSHRACQSDIDSSANSTRCARAGQCNGAPAAPTLKTLLWSLAPPTKSRGYDLPERPGPSRSQLPPSERYCSEARRPFRRATRNRSTASSACSKSKRRLRGGAPNPDSIFSKTTLD